MTDQTKKLMSHKSRRARIAIFHKHIAEMEKLLSDQTIKESTLLNIITGLPPKPKEPKLLIKELKKANHYK